MLTHEKIWLAIDRLAQRNNHSTSGLAKKAGLDPTSFNRSKRFGADGKPRWPSTESISRVLIATESTMAEFLEITLSSLRLPVMNLSVAQKNNCFDTDGQPTGKGWDEMDFPPVSPVEDYFALEISGDDYAPFYRDGDCLVLSLQSSMSKGDRVVVRTGDGDVFIKELRRKTASKIDLNPLYEDDEAVSLSPDDITWMARIMWVSQ